MPLLSDAAGAGQSNTTTGKDRSVDEVPETNVLNWRVSQVKARDRLLDQPDEQACADELQSVQASACQNIRKRKAVRVQRLRAAFVLLESSTSLVSFSRSTPPVPQERILTVVDVKAGAGI